MAWRLFVKRLCQRLGLAVLGYATALLQAAQPESQCLFATRSGGIAVQSCPSGDPLKISSDPRVLSLMQFLGIPASALKFSGCAGERFKAAPIGLDRYLVSYPTEAGLNYLVPIAHELMHVFQMRHAAKGPIELLETYGSLRLELSADYMSGFALKRLMNSSDELAFTANLQLHGGYLEGPADAHGTPGQRSSAFVSGMRLTPPRDFAGDPAKLLQNFYSNVYGAIVSY